MDDGYVRIKDSVWPYLLNRRFSIECEICGWTAHESKADEAMRIAREHALTHSTDD